MSAKQVTAEQYYLRYEIEAIGGGVLGMFSGKRWAVTIYRGKREISSRYFERRDDAEAWARAELEARERKP